MRNLVLLLLTPFLTLLAADPVIVSGADPASGVTANSLATMFGDHLASVTEAAKGLPWPESLGDLPSVSITDSAKHQQPARLLYVSPTQVNFWIPDGLAAGAATLSFPTTGLPPGVGAAALRNVPFTIQSSAPALFHLDSGVAAATAVRITIATRIQSPVPVYQCDAGAVCVAVPIDTGLDAPVYLSLYGTGFTGKNVTVTIGSTKVEPAYAGPQGDFPGLEQVNVPLPLSLRGSGIVNVVLTADGVASNGVKIAIQ